MPSIRPVRSSDLPAITAIYAEAVRTGTASFELEPPDEAEMTRRFTALTEGGFPYLVAEIDGEVAGYAYAGPYRPRRAYRFSVEDSIYVAPGRQGQGVGRALLNALVGEAEARGFRQMIAVVGDSNSVGSRRLHEAAGFHLVGILQSVGFKHGAWRDTVLMQRALGPGDETPPPPDR